jgi:ankyrin repeat protein
MWTPLHGAACYGEPVLIELLLAKGADASARNAEGDIPEDLTEDDNCKMCVAASERKAVFF